MENRFLSGEISLILIYGTYKSKAIASSDELIKQEKEIIL